ncbi:MAG: DMT family transporter [Pseudomonadota bacterium]
MSTPQSIARQSTVAALWMIGAVISFSAMAVSGRELYAELATYEIMAYRSLIGVIVIAGLVLWQHGRMAVATRLSREHGFRNVVHFAAQNCWFFAVATIPLAQSVALEFTNPLWVAVLAPALLGERLTRAGAIATLIGFAGILVVTRPGLSPLEWGHAAALGAAAGFALTNIFTKRLSREDDALTILFWMTASQAVMGFLCTLPFGGPVLFSWDLTPWVALVGLCGLTAHWCLTRALFAAPASVVAPMEFARLPVIAAAGALFYGEALESAVFIGAMLILGGNLYNIHARRRDAVAARSPRSDGGRARSEVA